MRTEQFKLLTHPSTFAVFRYAPFGIALHEMIFEENGNPKDYRILGFNSAFEQITQLRDGQLQEQKLSSEIAEIDPELIPVFGEVIKQKKSITHLHYSERLNRYLEIKAHTPGKNLIITIVDDVTDNHLKDKTLKKSEAKFRALHSNMTQGVVYQDKSGAILSANPSACNILGLSLDQMQGRLSIDPRWKSIKEDGSDFPGEDHPAMRALATGEIIRDVIMGVYQPEYDQVVWININAVPLFNEDEGKEPYQVFTTFDDISERKETELALLKSEKDRIQAIEDSRIKSSFLANMSHEIRTPLNGIIGMIDLLSESENLNNEEHYKVDLIKQSSEVLMNLLNDVLDLSKLQAGKYDLNLSSVYVNQLGKEITDLFSVQAANKKLNLVFSSNSEDIRLLLDTNKLRQLLSNILGNAIKFTENGFVTLEVETQKVNDFEAEVTFRVIDTGIGIENRNLESIFDQFKQIDDGLNKTHNGSGLGLSISKQLADLMGGKLEVESKFGSGSTFNFTLSGKIVKSPIDAARSNKTNRQKSEVTTSLNLDVLVVDDNPVNQKVAELMLQKMNCKVSTANNGILAIECCKKHKFDLILMDIQMPKMDGIQATQILKKEITDLPPIIGLSANALKGDAERFIEQGMDDYLSKPITITDLKNKILHWFPQES